MAYNEEYEGKYDDKDEGSRNVHLSKNNNLPLWGNERSMNLNPLILTNIQSSHYFKVNLYELKTYHEVIDEIYYKVNHLEPWEKGSRKTAGQTGMCGGVRGVGAGGIVSTAFCLLYKLFTLKLTRKQVIGLITHPDSPYIRALGFMYIRYTQPPADLWDWYEPYLDDEEEMDVKAGGGQMMAIGTILKNFLCKLEWYSTLFPRIPVPIQQKIEKKMNEKYPGGIGARPVSASSAGTGTRGAVSPEKNGAGGSKYSDRSSASRPRDVERSRTPPRRSPYDRSSRDVGRRRDPVRSEYERRGHADRRHSPSDRSHHRSRDSGSHKSKYEEEYSSKRSDSKRYVEERYRNHDRDRKKSKYDY